MGAGVLPALRHFLRHNRLAAIAILLIAVVARVAIPAGYMPTIENGRMVITLCSGQGPMRMALPDTGALHDVTAMDAAAKHVPGQAPDGHGKDAPCGFAGLSLPSLAAADPLLLALAILFVVTTLYRLPHRPTIAAPAFLWPPRTGPPARA